MQNTLPFHLQSVSWTLLSLFLKIPRHLQAGFICSLYDFLSVHKHQSGYVDTQRVLFQFYLLLVLFTMTRVYTAK